MQEKASSKATRKATAKKPAAKKLARKPAGNADRKELPRISYVQYKQLFENLDTPDAIIAAYSIVERSESGFTPVLGPNPVHVDMSTAEVSIESAMSIANGLFRWRRERQFEKRIADHDPRPVLVAEGDSWFQFPLLVEEIVDHLNEHYSVSCLSAAGDTLDNMVHGRPEYLRGLKKQKARVKAFLFSAAGNDIIGEDPVTGEPVLLELLRDYNGKPDDVVGNINLIALAGKLTMLKDGYRKVIANVRSESGLDQLPILIHGYDYVFPYPEGPADGRDPLHAKKNEWLGGPFDQKNFPRTGLRRNIIRLMLDELYRMMLELAGDPAITRVHVVDCRGAMPAPGDWIDEIHGTSDGFRKVAKRFRKQLQDLGIG